MNQNGADSFTALGLEPRPWQDADVIRQAYQLRARSLHPDADDGDAERFRELGAAFAQVRSVATRLRLLAAETGSDPNPVTDTDLFLQIGAALQTCRSLATQPPTALERALRQVETRKALEQLTTLRLAVAERLDASTRELRRLDDQWPDVPAIDLLTLAARFERLEKWHRQISEAECALQ